MNIEQMRAALAWITACLRQIHQAANERGTDITDAAERATATALTAEEQTRWDEGTAEVERLQGIIDRHELLEAIERNASRGGLYVENGDGAAGAPGVIVRNDPFDLSRLSLSSTPDEVRSMALGAIERTEALEDHEQEQAERVVRSMGREVAQRVLLTGSPEYRQAFAIAATRGLAACTDAQRQVLERAASLTDNAGGYAVPFTFDPTLIQTAARSTNPFRQIATIKQTTTDSWNGVSSAGVTFSWDAEAAEVSDDTPTLAQPSIPVYKGSGFVPFSVEIGGDWQNIEADLRSEFMVGKDNLEGAAFAVGTGSGQPTGITKALDGTSSEIAPGTAETFAIGDIFKVEQALEARYRANASWIANKVIYNTVRQFGDADSYKLWERLAGGQPPTLLGYNAYECSDMDGVLPNASATADNFLMVLGDFRSYYIVDRVGVSVELVPHLFHTSNNRPSGQRGLWCWFRTGADSVNDAAFAMLSIPTAA